MGAALLGIEIEWLVVEVPAGMVLAGTSRRLRPTPDQARRWAYPSWRLALWCRCIVRFSFFDGFRSA